MTYQPPATKHRPVCLFAHYDPQGHVWPHVVHYVAALASAGYRVVVASSGVRPAALGIEALRSAGAEEVVCRPNRGLDFGAWQALLRAGHADGAPAVLLANDSVYGPLWSLSSTIDAFTRRSGGLPDSWGMVESYQGTWHLQSWFVQVGPAALASPAVQRVFDQPFEQMTKPEVILHGELALGTALKAENIPCGALFRRRDWSRLARVLPSNPTHLDWRKLVTSRIVPFVKVELLRSNPMAIPWVNDWPDVLARRSEFPEDWISTHLYAQSQRARPSPAAPFHTQVDRLRWPVHLFLAGATLDHGAAIRSAFRQLLRGR